MTATFENTVSILVKAYLEGTLLKGHCCACAVGNICASAVGAKIIEVERWKGNYSSSGTADWDTGSPRWASVFLTVEEDRQVRRPDRYVDEAKRQIDATGYTWQQLAKIEAAFEGAMEGYNDATEFAGLMAVVDVLANIHGIDLAAAESAKLLFVRA